MNWFFNKGRSRNLRSRRKLNVLHTKLRTRSESNRRNKKLLLGWCVLLTLGVAAWAGWQFIQMGGRGLFSSNPQFVLRDVAIDHSGSVLTREEILRHSGVNKGQNLFEIDLKQVRANLELLPEVKRVQVRRQIPDRLAIKIEERQPIARVTTQQGVRWETYAIDEEGFIMNLGERDLSDRPLITGAKISDLRVGNPVASPEIFQAIDMIRKCELTTLNALFEIESVDVSRNHMLLVQTVDGMRAKIGLEFMDHNLRRLEFILNDARRKGLRVATADLTVDRDVPVVFRRLG